MNDIPIKNIYYMFLYVWNKVKDMSNISEKDIEGLNDFNDVLVELFLSEVFQILKKGLGRDYINKMGQTIFIKGKVDIPESLKVIEPSIICHFDEYSDDIILNQIIKEVLFRIIKITGISNEHKKKARRLLASFNNVNRTILDESAFSRINFNRFNKEYEYVIDLGKLIYKNSIPTEEDGKYKFIEIMSDEEQISNIFEEFLRRFYEIHTAYRVNRKHYNFDWEPIGNSDIDLLPRMETDIELISANDKIIIDAKYYKSAFSSRYEAKKLLSNNIYQMKAYLMQNLNKFDTLRGIIIYPSNGYEINERFYSEKGYSMEFMTVNLNVGWEDIKSRLLGFV